MKNGYGMLMARLNHSIMGGSASSYTIRRADIHNQLWSKLVILRINGSTRHSLGEGFLDRLGVV
jgi:hypothetical protein